MVVVTCLKEYVKLILGKTQIIINLAYRQGNVLHKFKESNKFVDTVKELRITTSTITKLIFTN